MQRSFRTKFSAGISGLAIAAAALAAGISASAGAAEPSPTLSAIELNSSSPEAMLAWDRVALEHAKAVMPLAREASTTWRFFGVIGADTPFQRNFSAMLRQHVQKELGKEGSLRDYGKVFNFQVVSHLVQIPEMGAMRITTEALSKERVVAVYTSIHSVKDAAGVIVPK